MLVAVLVAVSVLGGSVDVGVGGSVDVGSKAVTR